MRAPTADEKSPANFRQAQLLQKLNEQQKAGRDGAFRMIPICSQRTGLFGVLPLARMMPSADIVTTILSSFLSLLHKG
jgi:hypothetical protein